MGGIVQLSLKLRDDVIALMEEYQRREGASAGRPVADSKVSEMAMGYRDFVGILRKWDGGKKSPTLENIAKLESWLRQQLGEPAVHEILRDRERNLRSPEQKQ